MYKKYQWLIFGILIAMLWSMLNGPIPTVEATGWEQKVDPKAVSASREGETEFLVLMQDQADLNAAALIGDKTEKGFYVYETLTSFAETNQRLIQEFLAAQDVVYQPFWIANMLLVRGDIDLIQQLAFRPDVGYIYTNPQVQLSNPELDPTIETLAIDNVEWNILKINADDVWAEGYTGQGAVIGGQDTGYQWDHPGLINQYRGWNGESVNHDYNWFDATGLSPDEPVDPHSHGTHTMGTMVGDDGGSNQTGVAPGARWIGCRNMNASGYGTPASYAACYQWFVAPTRTDGSDPRPDLAPDVINNSWSCPEREGCTNPNILLDVVQAVRAAGILTVHSAGNSGPSCGTVDEPASIYAESFSVGSTTSSDEISYFSSRGPVTIDGSNRFKPQVTAPGSNIRSTIPTNSYSSKSGTSMAAPHVAGLAALLISAQPALAGRVDALETLIENSALPLYSDQDCGGDTHNSHPNHTYGWGRVDALQAYNQIPPGLLVTNSAAGSVLPGNYLTYTLTVTNSHPFSATHNVVLTNTIPDRTSLVSATGNYTVNSRAVTWYIGDLEPKELEQVNLIIHVPLASSGTITNQHYGAISDEVTTPATSTTVETIVHEPGVVWRTDENCFNHWLPPNWIFTCQHELYNSGNYTDTYQLSAVTINGDTTITPTTITIGDEQSAAVIVMIKAPDEAASGERINTTLTAASMADPSVSETLEIISWVSFHQIFPIIYSNP